MEGKKWAEPNMVQFAEQMRYMFPHRAEEKAKALETSKIIREKFSWPAVTLPMVERLKDIYKNKLVGKK
jgi:hypothetical protein